ncbi:MAG TPA: ABC transporter substrate-binding protein [Gemmatimonadaceae bacterium]|nr:ABC transporter substrate-binding protein [Gemmatimonadaceae bacterium]
MCACAAPEGAPTAVTISIPLINDPILNPVLAPDIGSVLINKVVFPGLVRPDEQLRPTPDLATGWTTSPDGREYTFTLRPGVKWHDGHPFTAHDVAFTFDQIIDVSSGSRLRSDFAAVAGVDVIDSLTVRFRLHAPFAPFLALLGYNAGILPAHAFAGRRLTEATEFSRTRPIGTGPFRVIESIPGSAIVLERNPDYYGAPPKADRLVFRIVPDVNAQVAQLRAGELDIVPIEPANLPGVEGAPDVTVVENAVPQHFYVGFNQSLPLFARPVVRRALEYAVNRRAIIDGVLKGTADPPRGTIPVVLRDYHDASVPARPFAPDSARALLAQAGWRAGEDGVLHDRGGRPFRFTLLVDKGNPTREQAALAVQQDLRRIGVDASLQTMEFATLVRDRVLPGNFEAVLIWWTTPPDPDQYAYYATGQDNNHVRYSNRVADSLLAAGRATADTARRRELYSAFQRTEHEDPPVLVLYYPREILAVSSRVRGLPRLGLRDALRHSEALTRDPR